MFCLEKSHEFVTIFVAPVTTNKVCLNLPWEPSFACSIFDVDNVKCVLFIWLGFLFLFLVNMNKRKPIFSLFRPYIIVLFLFGPSEHRVSVSTQTSESRHWRSRFSHLHNFAGNFEEQRDLVKISWAVAAFLPRLVHDFAGNYIMTNSLFDFEVSIR